MKTQISKKEIAECYCNKGEKKYKSLNAAGKVAETPEFKETMMRAFIDCFDNSKKNNWSKEMMLLCETTFLQSPLKVFPSATRKHALQGDRIPPC